MGITDSLVFHLEDRQGGPGTLLLLFVATTPYVVLDDGWRDRIRDALRRHLSPRRGPDTIKQILLGRPVAEVISADAVTDFAAVFAFQVRPRA